MKERKWTPGEWYIENGSKSGHCCFNASIYVKTGPKSWEYDPIAEMLSDNEGDIHLVRSAKDLYEALVAMEDEFVSDEEFNIMRLAALAKARGEV